jgi:hypothetical protein
VWPLAVAALVMGVVPSLWLNSIDAAVTRALPGSQSRSVQMSAAPPSVTILANRTTGGAQ